MASRWQPITASLRAAIHDGTLLPGHRLPSETELAAEWQVCRMTAHRAMDELSREGLVLRRRRAGTFVAEQTPPPIAAPRVGAIALLFFHAGNLPQADYIQGARVELPDEQPLLFCDTGNDPAREAQHLRRIQQEAVGVITYPTCAPENTQMYNQLIASGIAVVCVDRVPDGLQSDAVVTDNYGSTLDALRQLTGRGHRRIVYLGYGEESMQVSSARERYAAYEQALRETGEQAAQWTRLVPRALGHDLPRMVDVLCALLRPMLEASSPPTALFCKDDFVLSAALEACDRLGLAVPTQMEIVSFSDYPPMTLRHAQGVHRLVQQSCQMGQEAARRLQSRLASPDAPFATQRVPALYHAPTDVSPTAKGVQQRIT